MKKRHKLLMPLFLIIHTLTANTVLGQHLHVTTATVDSLWVVDTTSWSIMQQMRVTMPGATITGISALVLDPVEHDPYCLVATAGLPNASVLARINLNSGVCTQIGPLGQVFATLAFRNDGQLLGVIADGQPDAEKLYVIDKFTGASSLATVLGNGDNGEAIAFAPSDELLYHWSGSSQRIMEKLPSVAPFTPLTNVVMTGAATTGISAATYVANQRFLLGTIAGGLQFAQATGDFQPTQMTLPFSPSGLLFAPQFSLSDDFFCVFDSISWNFGGIAMDTAVYDWGDGIVESVFPAASRSHQYTVTGNFVTKAYLKNATSGLDIMGSRNIQVKPLPPVSLVPNQDTLLCFTDSLLISGSFGGTSQWYRNGIPIPGANTNVHNTSQSGWYNMTKRNQNGCIDSAAVGISVIFATQVPAPAISVDTTDCPILHFQSNDPIGTSWTWTFGDGSTGTGSNPSHAYSSIGIFNIGLVATNGCFSNAASGTAIVDCYIGLETSTAAQIAIFPNPNTGTFRLEGHLPTQDELNFQVLDANGKTVLEGSQIHLQHEWNQAFQLACPRGIYLLRWQSGTNQGTQRMIIQ